MATDRVIAMKNAQAAEANANAMKQMAETITAMQMQLNAMNEKMDMLIDKMSKPEFLFNAVDAEGKRRNAPVTGVFNSKPDPKKGGANG